MKKAVVFEFHRFRNFIQTKKLIVWLLALITLTAYSSKIFLYNYSIDTEQFMNKGIPFKWWISLGRYGLAFLSKLTTVGIDLNVTLTNVITYLLLFTSSVILSFIIWRSENKINSFWVVIAAGLYLTSPTMLEQTNFVLQSMEVSFAFNLLYIAILFIQYFIETKHKLFFALAMILTIIAFSIYTSLQAAFVVVTLLALYLHSDSNSYFSYIKNAVPYVIVLVASTLFNIVATKAISKVLNIPKNNYLSNMYIIGKVSIKTWITDVVLAFKQYFLQVNYFFFALSTLLFILSIICCLLIFSKRNINKIAIALTTIILAGLAAVLPMLTTGSIGPIRSYAPTYPLLLLLLTIIVVDLISKLSFSKFIIPIVGIVLLSCLLVQTKITNDFGVSEYNQFQAELEFKQDLQNRFADLGINNTKDYKFAFYGAKGFSSKNIIKGDVLGKSLFEWDPIGEVGVSNRATDFLNDQGLELTPVNAKEYKNLQKYIPKMRAFPSHSSVKIVKNYVIIRLSE